MSTRLLLGRDHGHFGDVHLETITEGVAAAISAGSDPLSPAMRFKGDFSNEDGLLVVISGDHLGLAVADAHYGLTASHTLLEALALSPDLTSIDTWLAGAVPPDDAPEDPSETTLVVLILDRTTGRGEGVSFGDSSCVQVSAGHAAWKNHRDSVYLRPLGAVDPAQGQRFEVALNPGDLLLLFTDGINECHYRRPQKSVGLGDMAELYGKGPAPDPLGYARRLTARALNGVNDHPGGQDNIALIVVRQG